MLGDHFSPCTCTLAYNFNDCNDLTFSAIFQISEEVFSAAEAMWFSPNGTSLAVASFNDTQVESAVYPYYGEPSEFDNQYPLLVAFKYPKVSFHLHFVY